MIMVVDVLLLRCVSYGPTRLEQHCNRENSIGCKRLTFVVVFILNHACRRQAPWNGGCDWAAVGRAPTVTRHARTAVAGL